MRVLLGVAGLSCIGVIGLVGPGWNCRRPCADDRDCGAYEYCAKYVDAAAAYVCEPGNQCFKPGDCSAGFACVARAGARTTPTARSPGRGGWSAARPRCACRWSDARRGPPPAAP
ncbi:MAG: hypothetical protein HY906_12600 [Deltaproteobacteria bacterium]|nr:hypothetical protein [Deltaproteobacteria bacterium]